MRPEEKKKCNSIYGMLIRNSVIMIVIVVLMGVLFFLFYQFAVNELIPNLNPDRLLSQEQLLKEEKYDKVQAGKSLGKKGYFEIVDENAQVLYCSTDKQNKYPSDFLEYIPDVYSGVNYYIFPVGSGEQKKYLLVRNDDDLQNGISGVAVLDAGRNVLYSDLDLGKKQLSSKILNVLKDNEDKEELFVQKYPFQTEQGEQRYLLVHTDGDVREMKRAGFRLAVAEIIAFFVLTILVIFIVGMRTAHKVRGPLQQLELAMGEIGSGKTSRLEVPQDIREVSQVMETFNRMEEKLQESEEKQKKLQEQQRKMLADISHDMKTPVTVIQGYIDAIDDGLVPEEEQKTCLRIIGKKAELLSELTNTFGEFSRLEHPDFHMVFARTDLCEYVREYIAGRYNELGLAGYHVLAEIPEQKKLMCRIDQTQLKRAFENIITNSLRHTEPGTEISVAVREEGAGAVIEIGDNGPGIPAELRDRVFEPFVVGDEARTSGRGTGLGLSIAKKIVEQHGGTIQLERTDRGAYFRIDLPLDNG